MLDDELIALARQAGWLAISPEIKEKLLAYGRLVIRRRNQHYKRKELELRAKSENDNEQG